MGLAGPAFTTPPPVLSLAIYGVFRTARLANLAGLAFREAGDEVASQNTNCHGLHRAAMLRLGSRERMAAFI